MDRKGILNRLTGLGDELEDEISKHKDPKMHVLQRGLNNITFDEIDSLLQLGDKTSTRSFLNIAHSRKFMQTTMIAAKCKELVERNKTASIRELYYQLKHAIANTKENTFEGQSESDPLIVDLET